MVHSSSQRHASLGVWRCRSNHLGWLVGSGDVLPAPLLTMLLLLDPPRTRRRRRRRWSTWTTSTLSRRRMTWRIGRGCLAATRTATGQQHRHQPPGGSGGQIPSQHPPRPRRAARGRGGKGDGVWRSSTRRSGRRACKPGDRDAPESVPCIAPLYYPAKILCSNGHFKQVLQEKGMHRAKGCTQEEKYSWKGLSTVFPCCSTALANSPAMQVPGAGVVPAGVQGRCTV